MPIWLVGEGRTEWQRVVAELKKQGRIAKTDRAVLAAYCDAWARYVEVTKQLRDYVDDGSKGQNVPSALFGVWVKLHERMVIASKELGLTVNSRLRLPAVAEETPEDPLEEMRRRGSDRSS